MVLSPNEIRKRAFAFVHDWEGEEHERAESQTFWNEFFEIFGITRRRVASFDHAAKNIKGNTGFIDLFWSGKLIVEMKSKGKSLDKAYTQALDYFVGLEERELPKYVIVSDFSKFRVYDLEKNFYKEFELKNLPDKLNLFDFIPEHRRIDYGIEDPVNIKAAEKMGQLHDALKKNGYVGHELEELLVRILFCLFAENTGIFDKDKFRFLIDRKTNVDGTDVGPLLIQLFQILNTPEDKRQKSLDEDLAIFPYIDGDLFKERLSVPSFDSDTRAVLLDCCLFDWAPVSPAIFGSMFQSVMDPAERHNLGAHYTSEKNILKTVNGLFLDDLKNEFDSHKNSKIYLKALLSRIGKIRILDPACGCGNFLIVSYRELRLLQIKIRKQILKLEGTTGQRVLDIKSFSEDLDVDAMYGIEILEFPARIAQVSLWLMDHLINAELSHEFGLYYKRLPLAKAPNIIIGNALRIDWDKTVPKKDITYILGNPPFVSKQDRSSEQQKDMETVCSKIKNNGLLDYVSCWYVKAADYIKDTDIKVAFVSTNAITHGEQVGVLWDYLLNKEKIKINFAHRTFRWSNDARGKAHVFVVIIGFGLIDSSIKFIFDYETPDSEPIKIKAKRINPYLVDFQDFFIFNRSKPICNVPEITFGSMPNDDGNFIFTDAEMKEFVENEPEAKKFIYPLISAREFLHGEKRWCLWLKDATPAEINKLPLVKERVEKVRNYRKKSKRATTVKLSSYPYLFGEIRQPVSNYLLIPRVSSETRKYIPIDFVDKTAIAGDTCCVVPDADLYNFGVMTSSMHMVWVNSVCGRLKSDYRYSNNLVYNNFPWPEDLDKKQEEDIRKAAKEVLDCRKKHHASLSDLYGPLSMPKDLLKAHKKLDSAVEKAYSAQKLKSDLEKLLLLFNLYLKYTAKSI
ncbi:MAG: N-6 DNA methylase [Candidatus Micrarchaeales archaeon]|nr:N-6 DNA methylase [Candidatus Micrarchaeales archaeon]